MEGRRGREANATELKRNETGNELMRDNTGPSSDRFLRGFVRL